MFFAKKKITGKSDPYELFYVLTHKFYAFYALFYIMLTKFLDILTQKVCLFNLERKKKIGSLFRKISFLEALDQFFDRAFNIFLEFWLEWPQTRLRCICYFIMPSTYTNQSI